MPKKQPGKTPKKPKEPTPYERFEAIAHRVLTSGRPQPKPSDRHSKRSC
ncbi:MAG: hypothetical protein H0T47_02920 [Planctomycetaceae bacterium]|nr:hypothetical protein [Planctomycetaceae bacterium]